MGAHDTKWCHALAGRVKGKEKAEANVQLIGLLD